MRSDVIKQGPERAPHRALLYGSGLDRSAFERPFIGVATSWNDIIPGHVGMRDLERHIERGVFAGGRRQLLLRPARRLRRPGDGAQRDALLAALRGS